MRLAVIPARGGSKRIPRKNIRLFHGKPMIAHSIETARQSNCFDRIIVSTDDAEIAGIAAQYGAEVPFTRPAELADDFAGTLPVIQHAIEACTASWGKIDAVCCIYATAPLLLGEDVSRGLRAMTPGAFAFSVTRFAFPIQRALTMDNAGQVSMIQPEYAKTRSQDLQVSWHDAGQFYWADTDTWMGGKPILSDGAVGIPLPRHRVQDIDTEEDWQMADHLFAALSKTP